MGVLSDLRSDVDSIVKSTWTTRAGQKIPTVEAVQLGNDAVEIEAAVLYADLANSTRLVRSHSPAIAAEIYKSFLVCCARVIRANGGEISAYDGDRVMAIYMGDFKRTAAAKTALQIAYCVNEIVTPALRGMYPNVAFDIKHGVGVAVGNIYVARTGIARWNDLLWLADATNIAAKLCGRRESPYTSFITEGVYGRLHVSTKRGGDPPRDMWQSIYWPDYGVQTYRSMWQWSPPD